MKEDYKFYLMTIGIVVISIFAFILLAVIDRDDAKVASKNLSKAAGMFEVNRRVIFYNGITNQYILSIEGLCSIKKDNTDNQLEVTCKTAENDFKKHFLGISDNVTYFVEQLEPSQVSTYHYRVIFKPQTIIPDVEFKGSAKELLK